MINIQNALSAYGFSNQGDWREKPRGVACAHRRKKRTSMTDIVLVVISPLKGFTLPSGKIMLTEKFVDGMKLYRELWDGPILHICEPANHPSGNLDNIEVPARNSDFDTICAPLTDDMLRASIPKRSLVLTSVGENFNSVSAICKELGVPCVYVTE